MQQIADWFEKLGMSEYVEGFAENHIDFSVLPDLTDQDLKDLGVVLGDRRKILRAIAGLKSTETVAPSPATEAFIVAAARRCRMPPGHGYVLRLGRLNGTVYPA